MKKVSKEFPPPAPPTPGAVYELPNGEKWLFTPSGYWRMGNSGKIH